MVKNSTESVLADTEVITGAMLYVILGNGTFITVVEGRANEPMHDHIRAYDALYTSLSFEEYLTQHLGFDSVRYSVIETIEREPSPVRKDCSLYIILDDCHLWGIVRGRPNTLIHRYVEEFEALDVHGELEEFLITEKNMEQVDAEVFDTISVLGPLRFAGYVPWYGRVFTN
jgi:hypothetical protein